MSTSNSLSCGIKTDWRKCFLCQTDTKEELKSPPTRFECSSDGYSTIAKNIPQFQSLNLLPIRLDPSRLDDGGGIEDTLRKNKAKYHHNCYQMFSNCKLERAIKRAAATRMILIKDIQRFEGLALKLRCFLCEKMEPTSELRW